MEPYSAYGEPAPMKRVGTCKLAVAAGLSSLLCPTGLGGLIGLVLGILGLAQIRATRGDLGGAPMAWVGIVLGLAQVLAVGHLYSTLTRQMDQAPGVAAAFLSGLSEGDLQSARASMTTGLMPTLDQGRGVELSRKLTEALGAFEGIGASNSVKVGWETRFVVEADYDLIFAKGAPATGHLTLVTEYGALKVAAFEVRSPVLRKPLGAKGKASQELGDFGGEKAARGRELKAFE